VRLVKESVRVMGGLDVVVSNHGVCVSIPLSIPPLIHILRKHIPPSHILPYAKAIKN
jgi:hypothetical protein